MTEPERNNMTDSEESDEDTERVNKEIKERKRLDKIYVKPMCPSCKTEVFPIKYNATEGQAKSIVAKVYHFLKEEFKDMQESYGGLVNLKPLQNFRMRTAFATGVSVATVRVILKEEREWLAARKRRHTEGRDPTEMESKSSSEDELVSEILAAEQEAKKAKKTVKPATATSCNLEEPPLANNAAAVTVLNISEDNYYKLNPSVNTMLVQPIQNQPEREEPQLAVQCGLDPAVNSIPDEPETEEQSELAVQYDMEPTMDTIMNHSSLNQSAMTDQSQCNMEPTVDTMMNHSSLNQSAMGDQSQCNLLSFGTMEPSINTMMNQSDMLNQSQVCGMEPSLNVMIDPTTMNQFETLDQSQVCGVSPTVSTACQTDGDIDPQLLIDDEDVAFMEQQEQYCNIDPSMNGDAVTIGPPTIAPLEAQLMVTADPQYFASNAGASPRLSLRRVDYAEGLGYYVII